LAARLRYTYVDTGAMYRALALKASRVGVSLDSEEALAAMVGRAQDKIRDRQWTWEQAARQFEAALRRPFQAAPPAGGRPPAGRAGAR